MSTETGVRRQDRNGIGRTRCNVVFETMAHIIEKLHEGCTADARARQSHSEASDKAIEAIKAQGCNARCQILLCRTESGSSRSVRTGSLILFRRSWRVGETRHFMTSTWRFCVLQPSTLHDSWQRQKAVSRNIFGGSSTWAATEVAKKVSECWCW